MRGVVIATGQCDAMRDFARTESSLLLPVGGRPFLHHVIEWLVDGGVSQIDVILSDLPEKVERSLGDGTRWGVTFRYHLVRDGSRPYGRLAVLNIGDTEPFVLAHGDRLPLWKFDASQPAPELVFSNGEWTGWGVLTGSLLHNVTDKFDEVGLSAELGAHVVATPQASVLLTVRTLNDFLEANWAVLEKRFPNLLLSAREASERIWISHNVSLHPNTQITAPVLIGENCRISAAVRLGPRVVIGNNCLVDHSSMLSETVLFPRSYVGQWLELRNAIVDRNWLVNVKIGAAITVADNFILGSCAVDHWWQLVRRAASRIVAGLLLVLTSPLLLLVWLRCIIRTGPAVFRKQVMRLPSVGESRHQTYELISFCPLLGVHNRASGAHEFFMHFLPGLINVSKGDLALVGVIPRSVGEIDALPDDWKQLYLGSSAGIITEAYVIHGSAPDEDEQYSAEVFYVATAGAKHDLKLAAGYFGRLLAAKWRTKSLDRSVNLEDEP